MKKLFLYFVTATAICFSSCKSSNDKIKNGIELKEDGLHVEEAFLTNLSGQPISNDNKVQVGDLVCLRLVVDGWQVKNGKVFLDAAQKVVTSLGKPLISNPSILGALYAGGATPADAKYVLLNQRIGKIDDPKNYVVIIFKVWDKTSNKSVSGDYKVYLQ
jgi:hypothetical protein